MNVREFFDSLDTSRHVNRNTLYFVGESTWRDLLADIRNVDVNVSRNQKHATETHEVLAFSLYHNGKLIEGSCLSPRGSMKCGPCLHMLCDYATVEMDRFVETNMTRHARDNSPAITWMQNLAVSFPQRLLVWMTQAGKTVSSRKAVKKGRRRVIEGDDGWSTFV